MFRALENNLLVRTVLKKHFAKKGLIVGLIPKPSEDLGNGAHAHMSLWKRTDDGLVNIVGDETDEHKVSAQFKSFMAGVLEHLPALMQFMAPHYNS